MAKNAIVEMDIISEFWLNGIRPPLDKALELVPDDKLDWAPNDKMITLGNIFMHIAEASSWWICRIIDQTDFYDYTPCPSFPKDKIRELMADHWRRMEDFFERCPDLFEKTYPHNWRGKPVQLTAQWIMLHLLEHDIHHRSQINHYLRILEIEPPKI